MNFKTQLPALIGISLLITVICLMFVKCNKRPLINPDIQKLETLEREKKELITKVNDLLKKEIDTVYIDRTRIKIKNDSILIYQSKVGNLPKDSASKLLIDWTSKPAIHD